MCWPRVGEANPLFSVCITLCRWTATARLSMPLNDRGISDYFVSSKHLHFRLPISVLILVLFLIKEKICWCQYGFQAPFLNGTKLSKCWNQPMKPIYRAIFPIEIVFILIKALKKYKWTKYSHFRLIFSLKIRFCI